VGQRNHALDGMEIPRGNRQFLGLSGPLKNMGVSAEMDAAKRITQSSITACRERDHLIHSNGTTRDAAICQNSLTTCYNNSVCPSVRLSVCLSATR